MKFKLTANKTSSIEKRINKILRQFSIIPKIPNKKSNIEIRRKKDKSITIVSFASKTSQLKLSRMHEENQSQANEKGKKTFQPKRIN